MTQFGSVARRVHALGIVLRFLLVTSLRGDDYSWNAPGGGNWNESAKWDRIGGGTGIPTVADNATIDVDGTRTAPKRSRRRGRATEGAGGGAGALQRWGVVTVLR
jgi:hypothetical protein